MKRFLWAFLLLSTMVGHSYSADFKVSVMSDVHLDLNYDPWVDSSAKCQKGGNKSATFALYGRRGCNCPYTLFISALKKMKSVEPNPDVVLVPGDLVTHFVIYEEDLPFSQPMYQEIIGIINNFTASAASIFPDTPIVFTQGNTDYLYDYQVPKTQYKELHYKNLYNAWITNVPANRKRADNIENSASMSETGSYTMELRQDLVVISFNSVYFSKRNKPDNDPGVAEKLLKWIEGQLETARKKSQHAILLYHLPHGTYITSAKENVYWASKYHTQMGRMMKEYKGTVSASFTGHIHVGCMQSSDQTRVLQGNDKAKIAPELYNSMAVLRAVTPMFSNNPGFAIFYYANGNFNYLSHFDEYTFLLNKSFNTSSLRTEAFWQHLYNSKKDLGMENLGSDSVGRFVLSLSQNPRKRSQYLLYMLGEPAFDAGRSEEFAKRICRSCDVFPEKVNKACVPEFAERLRRFAALSERSGRVLEDDGGNNKKDLQSP